MSRKYQHFIELRAIMKLTCLRSEVYASVFTCSVGYAEVPSSAADGEPPAGGADPDFNHEEGAPAAAERPAFRAFHPR